MRPARKNGNDFEHVQVHLPNSQIGFALRATCSRCGHDEEISISTKTCEQAWAQRLFGRKGWRLGNSRKNDICGDCVAKERTEKLERKKAAALPKMEAIMPANVIALATKTIMQKEAAPMAVEVEKPPVMSREDRRIIFAKINDVYVDENVGYDNGWSDKRVAEDLNVPRAWVAEVREEHFGPEASNDEAREVVAEARTLADMAATLLEDGRKQRAEWQQRAHEIDTRFADLRKRIDALEKLFR